MRSASASMTFSSVRFPGAIVVSLSCARHHLAKAFEAADFDLGIGVKLLLQQLFLVLVVARIERLAAMRQTIKRRHRKIEMAVIDQLRHLPVEEGDEERCDMRAVDVGVGHHDHLVVCAIPARDSASHSRSRAPE